MKKTLRAVKCIALACVVGAMQSQGANLPDKLLNMPIHLMSGKQTSLAAYKGRKPVYIKFWATYCRPCLKQLPHFEHVQQQYGDKIQVIGINLGLNEDLDTVTNTIKKFHLTMPMAIDRNGDLTQAFHLTATPYYLLFDKDMNLVDQGHEVDESLDNKLALLASGRDAKAFLNPDVLEGNEPDIKIKLHDGRVHALLFTATWGDWYLKDSRPKVSKSCIAAQHDVNDLFKQFPEIAWMGVVSRLWTGDQDLQEYKKKFDVQHPVEIDKSNRLFHQYQVNDLPVLLFIRNGEVLAKITDFEDEAKISTLIHSHKW